MPLDSRWWSGATTPLDRGAALPAAAYEIGPAAGVRISPGSMAGTLLSGLGGEPQERRPSPGGDRDGRSATGRAVVVARGDDAERSGSAETAHAVVAEQAGLGSVDETAGPYPREDRGVALASMLGEHFLARGDDCARHPRSTRDPSQGDDGQLPSRRATRRTTRPTVLFASCRAGSLQFGSVHVAQAGQPVPRKYCSTAGEIGAEKTIESKYSNKAVLAPRSYSLPM